MSQFGCVVKLGVKGCSEAAKYEEMNLTISDFGGDNEYFMSSKLFFVDNGIYMIMFDASEISREKKENLVPCIGNYVELILQNSNNPVIILTASKNDAVKKRVNDWEFLIRWIENYVTFLTQNQGSRKQTVYLLDKILITSSKAPEGWVKQTLELVSSLICNKKIVKSQMGVIPMSWNMLLTKLKGHTKSLEIEEIKKLFEEVKEESPKVKDQDLKNDSIKAIHKVLAETEEIFFTFSDKANQPKKTKQKTEDANQRDNHGSTQIVSNKGALKETQQKIFRIEKQNEADESYTEDKNQLDEFSETKGVIQFLDASASQ